MVINKGLTIGNKSLKEHFEVINHKECIGTIEKYIQNKTDLSIEVIKELHKIILKNIDDSQAGILRRTNVRILGAAHICLIVLRLETLLVKARFFNLFFQIFLRIRIKLNVFLLRYIVDYHPQRWACTVPECRRFPP